MTAARNQRGHDHLFGEDLRRPGESRTLWVIALTASTMVVEIAAGLWSGSMALLADGLHMASHAVALLLAAAAYVAARRWAGNPRFSFGTGKVNALGGYTGAVLLAVFAAFMAIESVRRVLAPVAIHFDEAIAVAVLGLVVNGVSVVLLDVRSAPAPGDDHDHTAHDHHQPHHHHDHNLRAAFLHVLADALTSVLAIVALLAGKLFGAAWLDPVMGIVGSVLVARWSWSLLASSGQVLLDRQRPEDLDRLHDHVAAIDGVVSVHDLHLWSIGPGYRAAIVSVVARRPVGPELVARHLPDDLGIRHLTVEVQAPAASDGNR